MGAGTNVQDRLTALHHLDVPWRPFEEERARRYIGKFIFHELFGFSNSAVLPCYYS